jgi:very-short-patch-repair endonuclease
MVEVTALLHAIALAIYERGTCSRARRTLTDAERRLWSCLRLRQLGVKFRRQAPIGNYVVDFLCFEKRLIVEVDGSQHALQTDQERKRTDWLEAQGFRIVRIWNNDALQNTEGAVEHILRHLMRDG